jgi:catechol 2,3-dioxygenase-like lactoylglutathione lyase family enzyme
MDWKLELVQVPVSDVDRAKACYTEKLGFNADHDHQVSDEFACGASSLGAELLLEEDQRWRH